MRSNIFITLYYLTMNKGLDCIAFHEAGHCVAHILVGIPFEYVTIKEEKDKDEYGNRSLGHIMYDHPKFLPEWEQYSILNPDELIIFLRMTSPC